jgi:RNA-directed DNA polymerase
MSLSPQTIRVRHRLAEWTKSGRKHWDLYRWISDSFILYDAAKLVLRNKGTAGIDGVACDDIRGREWEYAEALSHEIRSGTYRPCAVKRVYIPKRDGRKRPLRIPALKDRIVQRALVLLLEPIYELVFLPASYGYRRGQSGVECASHTAKEVYYHRFALEADIEGFFDNMSHNKLIGMLKERIADPRIHRMVRSFLTSGYFERDKPWQATWSGTPQGGPLSPMLANIYMHYTLDAKFQKANIRGVRLVRYCDDFLIMAQTESRIKEVRTALERWIREGGLKLKESKTRVVNMSNNKRTRSSHFDFLGFRFHLRSFRDNPERFWVARQPSEEARKALHKNLKSKLTPDLPVQEAQRKLAETWNGWCQYFRYGNSTRIFYKETRSIRGIIGWYLRGKYRQGRRPVRWDRLYQIRDHMLLGIRPMRVISRYVSQQPCLL